MEDFGVPLVKSSNWSNYYTVKFANCWKVNEAILSYDLRFAICQQSTAIRVTQTENKENLHNVVGTELYKC